MASKNYELHQQNTKVAEDALKRAEQFIKANGLPFKPKLVPIHYALVYMVDGKPVDGNAKEFEEAMTKALIKENK